MKTAIFISGRGSNMQALLENAQDLTPINPTLVIANTAKAKGLETAKSFGVDTFIADYKTLGKTKAEESIQEVLLQNSIDFILLAGFMRILSAEFLRLWENKILNIHPSLLPAFIGLDTHQRVLDSGAKFHGATVHKVIPDLDAGEILGQVAISVLENDTSDTLAARLLPLEHILYQGVILKYYGAPEKWRIFKQNLEKNTEQYDFPVLFNI